MKFNIPKNNRQMIALARQIGYVPQKSTNWDEMAFTRSLMGGEFPRFHLYEKEDGANFVFNLHLDQQQSKYGNNAAHGGEYSGELVEGEASRIQSILTRPKEEKKAIQKASEKEGAKENSGSMAAIFKKIFGN